MVRTSSSRFFFCLPVAPSVSLLPLASDLNLAQQDPAPVHPRNSFIHAPNKPRWLPNIRHKHNSTAKFNSTAGLRDGICFSSGATAALSLSSIAASHPHWKKYYSWSNLSSPLLKDVSKWRLIILITGTMLLPVEINIRGQDRKLA